MAYTTPEKKVQNKIIKYMDQLISQGLPLIYWHRVAGGINWKKGMPDLYASFNGQHIEIECKRESGGSLSTMQEKYRDIFKSINILYVCPSSFDDFKAFIDPLINIYITNQGGN